MLVGVAFLAIESVISDTERKAHTLNVEGHLQRKKTDRWMTNHKVGCPTGRPRAGHANSFVFMIPTSFARFFAPNITRCEITDHRIRSAATLIFFVTWRPAWGRRVAPSGAPAKREPPRARAACAAPERRKRLS